MNNCTISLPFTPAKMLNHKTYNAKKLTVTWGGGLGGSSWEVITTDNIDLRKKFIEIADLNNKHTTINSAYIVRIQNIVVAECEVRNLGNNSYSCPPVNTSRVYRFECEENANVIFNENAYANNPKEII